MYHPSLKNYFSTNLQVTQLVSSIKTTQNAYYAFSFLFLSAFLCLHRSLSSINDRTWETCAPSNVWLYFSFCWQSKGSERDNPATPLHLAQCYICLQSQKKLLLATLVSEKRNINYRHVDSNCCTATHFFLYLLSLCKCNWSQTNWNKGSYGCVSVSVLNSIRGWSVMDCLPSDWLFVNFENEAV